MNSQFLHENTLLCFMYGSGFVQDFLNVGIRFLHIHWLKNLASLEDKFKPATCISNSLARSGHFFFLNTSHPILDDGKSFAFPSQDFSKFLPLN